jgi:DdrB-like protein
LKEDQFELFIFIQERQALALEKIARLLEQQLPRQPAPNYQATLEKFPDFDWASIGATVEKSDRDGVALVSWARTLYKRRSPDNAYGAAIFFSRCVGRNEAGQNQYERLITFTPYKEQDIQPISRAVERLIKS